MQMQHIQNLALKFGATIVDGFDVQRIDRPGENLVVVTGAGEGSVYCGESVVLCPGPWASSLLEEVGLGACIPLKALKIPVYYWKVRDSERSICHSFIYEKDNKHIFGLPPFEYKDLFKV